MNDNITPMAALATYGSLMRGKLHHERFCSGYLDVQRVEIPGVLRWLSPTIPVLEVPESLILAVGTEDPFADVATQARWAARFASEGQPYQDGPDERPHPVLGAVAGEVFTFEDAEPRLPRLDALEGFRPDGNSLYCRFLLAVREASRGTLPVWVYASLVQNFSCRRCYNPCQMPKQPPDTAAAREKVAAMKKQAMDLGWPEVRLEALERILQDEDEIGEVCETHIEIVTKLCGTERFYLDPETSFRMAGE